MRRLSSEERAIVDLARDVDDPERGARDRVRRRLAAQLGAAAGLSATAGAASTAGGPASAAATSAVLAKVVEGAVLLVMAGALSFVVWPPSPPPVPSGAPQVSLAAPILSAAPSRRAEPVAKAPRALDPPPPAIRSEPVLPRHPVSARPSYALDAATAATVGSAAPPASFNVKAPDEPPPPVRAPEPPATLEAEVRLVQAARSALRAGDARAALAALDDHAREFPTGVLAEERAAQRVLALCALGDRPRAEAEAAAFVHAHPHSPLAAKVRAPCAGAALE